MRLPKEAINHFKHDTDQIWLLFSYLREEKLMIADLRPPAATVPRTVAFGSSNLSFLFLQNKNDLSKQVVLFCA